MNYQELYKAVMKAYMATELPTALLYNEKIESNAAFKNQFGVLRHEKVREFLSELCECSGVCHKFFNNMFYSVNVIRIADITIIEFTDSQPLEKIINTPSVRKYLIYLFSKIHLCVNSIASAASELYTALLMNEFGDERVTAPLNSIDSALIKIAEALVDPEQLVYLTSYSTDESTISLKDETDRFVKDLQHKFGRHVRVTCRNNDLIFARINRNTIRTLLADAINQFRNKEFIPDSIIISSENINDSDAQITIESICASKNPYISTETQEEAFARNLFFDYICNAFCHRYNGSFQQQETDEGYKFTITFPLLKACAVSFCTPNTFKNISNRFDVVNLRFAEFEPEKYGKNTD